MSQKVTDRDDQGRKRWPEDDDESKHWYHRNNVGCALLAGIGLLFVVLVWLVLFPIKLDWNPTPIACPPPIACPTPIDCPPPFKLGIEQLNARASLAGIALAGTYTYQPVAGTVLNSGPQLLSVTFVPSHLQLIDWLELIVLAAIIILAILLGLSHYSRQRWSDAVRWGMLLLVMLLALALVLYALSFKSASATVYLDVPKTTTIYWSNPAPITEGTPLSDVQLNAIVDPNVPGVFTYTPGKGTVLPVGLNQPLTVTFMPTDTNYCPSTKTVHIDVMPFTCQTTTIDWSDPDPITEGTPLSDAQLNAKVNPDVPGRFIYTPGKGTVLHVGLHQPLTVTFTPTDTNYCTSTMTVHIDVKPRIKPPCARYHVVCCGETLFSIGRMYGVNPWDIAAANHLPNPNQIFVGQRLCIPPRPPCPPAWCGCGPYPCGW